MKKSYEQALGEQAAKDARKRWGAGWSMLGERQQRGEVAIEVVSILLTQQTSGDPDGPVACLQKIARVAYDRLEYPKGDRGEEGGD